MPKLAGTQIPSDVSHRMMDYTAISHQVWTPKTPEHRRVIDCTANIKFFIDMDMENVGVLRQYQKALSECPLQ